MYVVNSWKIKGFQAEVPHERILKVILSPDQGGAKNVSMGMTLLPPNSLSNYHKHDSEEELWFVISGRGKAIVNDQEFQIEAGTAIYISPGEFHQLVNTSDETLKVLWIFAPPGPEKPFLRR
jgi:mannose-6-phosphate isomerase-like protein (cupin superfamily)